MKILIEKGRIKDEKEESNDNIIQEA